MLLNEFLERSSQLFPDKEALVCNERRFTYRDIESMSNRLANAFIANTLQKQDRVAVYLENSPESVVSIFGTLKAGGIFVVVNPQVKAKKLEYILNDCQVKILVTDQKHLNSIADVLQNCPSLTHIVLTDKQSANTLALPRSLNVIEYAKTLAETADKRPEKRVIDVDLASLIYTSGSTGNPKGVMLTHLNMVSAANSITEYLENTENDIILNCLPLSFDYGLYQVLMAFKCGGKVVLERSFVYPYVVIDRIMKEKVTGLPLVPTMVVILLQLKNLGNFDLSSLRYITNTAQALAPKHIVHLMALLPRVSIYSMYGLTECKRVSYMPPAALARKPSSVGKAMPNTEAYIINENGLRITEPGVTGELVVRGANVMKGYWNLPEETDKRLKPGSIPNEMLLHTGDFFKMDEEGYLYFISRKDDIIKTSGERVSPKEVENALYEMDEILEAAVVGVPDDILGQAIKAVLVLKDGCAVQEKQVIQHCAKILEPFMIPKFIEFSTALPKTVTGKLKKTGLSEPAVAE